MRESAWNQVYEIVKRIPKGRIMNYGQIAGLLERPLSARAVGWLFTLVPPVFPGIESSMRQVGVPAMGLEPIRPVFRERC